MKANGGELIKNLRKNMGVSQEELAKKLFMSQQKLSRIEMGELELDIVEFITAFATLGFETDDFWIVHLNPEEFEGYAQYLEIRRLIKNDKVDKIRDLFPCLSKNPLMQRSFMSQFLSFVSVIIDEKMETYKKLKMLYNALKLSIKDFEDKKIAQYCLTYCEILIISEISRLYAKQEAYDRAIILLNGMMENVDNFRITPKERRLVLPEPLIYLYELLMEIGEYERAAEICEKALAHCVTFLDLKFAPHVAYTLGLCYQKMGRDGYMPLFTQAYHSARAIEQHELANKIKEAHGVS